MSTYYVGSDHCYNNSQHHVDVIAKALKDAGHTVNSVGVGPNKESVCRQHAGENDTILVFICCGIDGCTEWSIKEAIKGGHGCKTVFAYTGFAQKNVSTSSIKDADTCDNYKIGPSGDAKQYLKASSRANCIADIAGRTHKEYHEANSAYIAYCYSDVSIEDLAQKIVEGNYFGGGTGGSTTEGSGGSAVKIPDRTFYGLIKQICGATDSLFITANNMAYLLTFRDYYHYRDKYEDLIPTLTSKEVLTDSIEQQWSTTNFYNTVEIKYKGGTLTCAHDALVAQYGELKFHYEFKEDDYETAKSKASALLAAHIRDYAMDIKLTCLYDENITVGSWVKVKKSLINSKKSSKKTINSSDYDLFFVQGYSLNWNPSKSLVMDLHLKYSPDTPQDPINATIGVGGGGSTSSSSPQTGPDCFGVSTAQLYGDHRIPHSGKGGLEYAQQNEPSSEMTQGRCKEGSSYQQEMNGKNAQEVFYWATQQFKYCCYADNCKDFKCTEERLNSGVCGFNCGDSACILKSLLDCIGVRNWVFHIHGHYHNIVEVDGQLQTADLSRRVNKYTHTVKWPAAQRGSCNCPCHAC